MKKNVIIFFGLILIGNSAFSQNLDSLKIPYLLQSEKEIKMRKLLSRIGNYDHTIGQSFGDFFAKDITGKNISVKDLESKITFINFWFEACPPCHLEFNNINNLYNRYKLDSNFQIISFTFDSIDEARENADKYNLQYRIISIPRELCYKLNFRHGFPTNFIVNSNGKVFFGHTGVGNGETNAFTEILIPKIDSLLSNLKSSNRKVL
jgi:peroxiredoxin